MKTTYSAQPGLIPLAITVDRNLTEAEGKLFHAILEGAPPQVLGIYDIHPDPDPETGLANTPENKFDQLTDTRLWFPIYDDNQWIPCCRSQGLENTEDNRLKIIRMLQSIAEIKVTLTPWGESVGYFQPVTSGFIAPHERTILRDDNPDQSYVVIRLNLIHAFHPIPNYNVEVTPMKVIPNPEDT